ncbi:DnaD domain protein [Bacillus sp. RD4P76]|uniref:DnaD domain protein n=1 Tax=Bacillus suaedaesalsae TaxID=2810349 RepID=A0ABS2DDX9_9BACI|nr:DnaD domain protein [Bacillus suaedaesalsae]
MVRTDFWLNPIVSEEMTPEDRYFYLYLLTNHHTTQCGIYKITKKQIAFDMGYSIEAVNSLMTRFIEHHELIQYNPVTRELAIKNWGKDNLHKAGKPVLDCILSELKEVQDLLLIGYVAESIVKEDLLAVYESFCDVPNEEDESFNDTLTIRGQKEKEKQKEKENKEQKEKENKKQQQETLEPSLEFNIENESLQNEEAKEIIEFWDQNGFGYSNLSAKKQLLSWLYDSSFENPKDMVLKALEIACSRNKRQLNYVIGILRNWEMGSSLTLDDATCYDENKEYKKVAIQDLIETYFPKECVLDLTAGEDW